MELLKKSTKKIIVFLLVVSSFQSTVLFGSDDYSVVKPQQKSISLEEELPQGPEKPGVFDTLRSRAQSGFEQVKASLNTGWQNVKEVARSQTLKGLNTIMPNATQQLRAANNALKPASSLVTNIMQALAIPEEPTEQELSDAKDARIAALKDELSKLQGEFPTLNEASELTQYAQGTAEMNALRAKEQEERAKMLAQQDPNPWGTAEKNIKPADIKKAFDNLEAQKRERQRIYNRSEQARKKAEEAEKYGIEKIIQEIETANATQGSELRYKLKNALETGNLDIDLFTPEQIERTGLTVDRIQADLALQKNKERGKALVKQILNAQESDASQASELKNKLEADLLSGVERIKTFGLSQLKKIGFDDAALNKIEEKERQRFSFGLGGYILQAAPGAKADETVQVPMRPVVEGLD